MKYRKVYCSSRFFLPFLLIVFFVGLSETISAQSTTKSTNITTINGKKYYLHKVSHAQSLYGIAKIYGVDMNTIIKENPGTAKGVVVGQELKIPYTNSSSTNNSTTTTQPVKQETVAAEPEEKEEETTSNNNSSANTSTTSSTPDLLSLVEEPQSTKKEKEYVTATFKSTRNINFHTAEVLGKRCLDFRISHRFGPLSSGANNAWGLDGPANLMLSLEYSHDGRWMVGISRCIENKTAEAFVKVKILRQVKHGWPFTVTYFGGIYHTFVMQNAGVPVEYYRSVGDRVSYVNQALFASKITSWLSVQFGYAWVHFNLVDGKDANTNSGYAYHLSNNDCHVLTGIIRAKYNKRQAIIFEYAYRLNTNYASIGSQYYNSMGIGWEIETGGHVFQLFATNSYGIMENSYLMCTNTSWKSSGVRIGFNITRVFAIGKKSKSNW